MRIVIVGYGNIGKHVFEELKSLHPDLYDPPKGMDTLHASMYDIAIICVPTDSTEDGRCDTSLVEKAVKSVNAEVYLIKSAVEVGTTERLAKETGKNIVVSPEYYGTTQHSAEMPNFITLGGDRASCDRIAQLYYKVKNGSFRIKYTDSRTAELAKYMENCFLALKVTFCCEFYEIAKGMGISYPELRELFVMDGRMGDSHTLVYEDSPFYDSHCLNKDIPALLYTAGEVGVETPLIKEMNRINEYRKLEYGA